MVGSDSELRRRTDSVPTIPIGSRKEGKIVTRITGIEVCLPLRPAFSRTKKLGQFVENFFKKLITENFYTLK